MNTSSKPGEADDVARVRFLNFDALHALEMKNGGDFALGNFAVAVTADRRVADLDLALVNFAERDTPEVIASNPDWRRAS